MTFAFGIQTSASRAGFKLAVKSFSGLLKIEENVFREAATNTAKRLADGAKNELRDDVKASGLGNRLAFTWQGKHYPRKGTSVDAAAFIYSNAPVIKRAHTSGAIIRAYDSEHFLAIPTKETDRLVGISGRFYAERITPATFEETTGIDLTPRPTRKGGMVLTGTPDNLNQGGIKKRKGYRLKRRYTTKSTQRGGKVQKQIVYFILVRQVTLPKRLNSEAIAKKWANTAPRILREEHNKARNASNQIGI